MKQTIVFDFDGVIHSYTSGWKGITCIPDPPVHGIEKALKDIHDAGYEVVIVSTRCDSFFGRVAIENWLDLYGLSVFVDRVCKEKPPAIVYIDDRAICFDGHPEKLLEKIKAFKPWNKSPETNADRIRSMSDEELAEFLDQIAYARETPWSIPFQKKICNNCPTTTCIVEGYHHPMELNECDFADGECPHGSDIVWWLQQPAEGDDNA